MTFKIYQEYVTHSLIKVVNKMQHFTKTVYPVSIEETTKPTNTLEHSAKLSWTLQNFHCYERLQKEE